MDRQADREESGQDHVLNQADALTKKNKGRPVDFHLSGAEKPWMWRNHGYKKCVRFFMATSQSQHLTTIIIKFRHLKRMVSIAEYFKSQSSQCYLDLLLIVLFVL